jgi:hypothetical protein
MMLRVFIQISRVVCATLFFQITGIVPVLHAQNIQTGSYPATYIPLTTFEYDTALFEISGPVNVLVTEKNGFRAYFDLENSGQSEITELQVWLLVYYRGRSEPALFEKSFSTSILPGSSNSFFLDETLKGDGEPVDGVIVPLKITFADNTIWNLSDNYLANDNVKGNGTSRSNDNGSRYSKRSIGSEPYLNERNRPGAETANASRVLDAVQITEQINLDGVLDEEVWKTAEPATGFLQTEPVEGVRASEITEVFVLYDEKNLYIGANLYDSDPNGILGFQKKRDEGLWSDDRFMWIIDTFLDGRTGYFFETNPAGLLGDGLIGSGGGRGGHGGFFGGGGGGGGVNKSWDGIWNVETSIHDQGWTAEIRIPFQTLNFDPENDVWGINFQRTIRRKNEELRWSGHKRNQPLTRPVHAGRLNGIRDISQGLGLEIKPYATLGRSNTPNIIEDGIFLPNPEDPTDDPREIGFDISYNITSSLRSAISVNTDFAEVEVDQRRVNLTRFPLFFQEKRDFFLEGSSVFGFSPRSGVTPYFSRRIGLTEGEQIPVLFGGRLAGTVGRNEIGLIQVRTDENVHAEAPVEDFTVARIKRSLFEQSTIGAIYTRRSSDALNEESAFVDRHTVGADFNLFTSKFLGDKNLQFEGFYIWHTDPEDPEREGTPILNDLSARGFSINYPNDTWNSRISYRELGEDYDPSLGFVRRNGFRRVEPNLGFNPRPDFIPWLRQLRFRGQWRHLWNMSNQLVTRNIQYTVFNPRFESGDSFSVQFNQNFELLDEEFEISDGLFIPAGEYSYNEWRIFAFTAGKRPVSGFFNVSFGDFWSGEKLQYSVNLSLRPFPGLNLESMFSVNDVTLPQGDFKTKLYRFESGFFPTPWTSLIGSLQYDDVSEVVGLFTKFRWIVNPGSDIFLVYTHNWRNVGASIWDFDTRTLSQGAASKINYTYRF